MRRKEPFITVAVMLLLSQNFVHAGDFIAVVSKDSHAQDMRELYSNVKKRFFCFFSGDKEKEELYKITDPKNQIKPFLLSGRSAQKMTHEDAKKYCDGAALATEAQLLALNRAIQPFPHYQFAESAIANISDAAFWGAAINYAHPENVFYFSAFAKHDGEQMSYVSFFTSIKKHKAYARCVLPLL